MIKVYILTGAASHHELEISDQRLVGRGAVGAIYRLEDPNYPGMAAKIYHTTSNLELARIEAMIADPPKITSMVLGGEKIPTLAWPSHLVYDAQGRNIGYLMPYIDLRQTITLQEYLEDINSLSPQDQSISLRINVARNLCAMLAEMHNKRNYFIDLKPQNIRVFKESGNIALLDCDGFSIAGGRYPATHYSSQYLAPEAIINRATPQSLSLNDYQDRFALSIILFQILNFGIHPYQGIPVDLSIENATTDEYLKLGWYPYGLTPNRNLLPHPLSIHEYWDHATRTILERAFTAPKPSQRPTAKEWLDHIDGLLGIKAFARCGTFPNDVRHIHFKEKKCFVCEKFESTKQPKATKPLNQPLGVANNKLPPTVPVSPRKKLFLFLVFSSPIIIILLLILIND